MKECDDKKSCCVGGMCAHGTCHSHYVLLRWVLGIIVLVAVYSIGYMCGELRGEFGSGRDMGWGGYGNYGMMQNFGVKHCNGNYGLIRGAETNTPAPVPAPASTTNTATQK